MKDTYPYPNPASMVERVLIITQDAQGQELARRSWSGDDNGWHKWADQDIPHGQQLTKPREIETCSQGYHMVITQTVG